MPGLEVPRENKAGLVYDALKEAILSGQLEPGAPIDKAAICERLGVSRFPASTAIGRLAFERLVVVEPQHGSFVAGISIAGVREALFIRRALETEIAARAASELEPARKRSLEGNVEAQAKALKARDLPEFFALDIALHQSLADGLGLRASREILGNLRAHLERLRRMLMQPSGNVERTLAEHRALVEAIAKGSAVAAGKAMATHIAAVAEAFEAFARQNPTLFVA